MKMVQKKVDRKAEYPHYARSHTLMANRLNIRKNSATNQSKREDLRFLTRKTRTEGNGSHHTISITISADKRISTHSCLGNTYTKCHLKSWNFWKFLELSELPKSPIHGNLGRKNFKESKERIKQGRGRLGLKSNLDRMVRVLCCAMRKRNVASD